MHDNACGVGHSLRRLMHLSMKSILFYLIFLIWQLNVSYSSRCRDISRGEDGVGLKLIRSLCSLTRMRHTHVERNQEDMAHAAIGKKINLGPVCFPHDKCLTGGLVVRWVITDESPPSFVLAILFAHLRLDYRV